MPPKSISTKRDPKKGLCLLSLDAGGSRGISQLKILVDLMHSLNFESQNCGLDRPCSVFDLIGGVGSAGFIAILLVIFGLTAREALEEFIKFSHEVLEIKGVDTLERTSILETFVNNLMGKYGMETGRKIMDPNERSKGCKLVVPILYKRHIGSSCAIRNFDIRHGQGLNVTVPQAILATLANPPLFMSACIFKDAATFEYVGGDLLLSNPIREIIDEAHGTFGPEAHVACLLSLGCGHFGVLSLPENANLTSWSELLKKIAADSEQKARNADSQMGDLGIYHRFSVEYGMEYATCKEAIDLQDILAFIIAWVISLCSRILGNHKLEDTSYIQNTSRILSQTAIYLTDRSLIRKTESCVNSIKAREGLASLTQLARCGGGKVFPRVPPSLSSTFVMRLEPWAFIEKAVLGVDMQRMLAITGGGGYGKSQLVLKFLQVHGNKFVSIFFIDGSSEARIRADTTRNVRSLGIEHSQKLFDDCLIYLAQPSPSRPRLIVYDNIDDPKLDIPSLLPPGDNAVIILTSRNHSIGEMCRDAHLKLDVMSTEEAVELLLRGTCHERPPTEQDHQAMVSIAEVLGCHPIALSQACSYMYQTRCSPPAYLEKLQKNPVDILAKRALYQRDARYSSAFAAFEASFEMVPAPEQRCLQLLSCFHWEKFPLELINLAAEYDFSSYEYQCIRPGEEFEGARDLLKNIFRHSGQWNSIHLDDTTTSLQNYSLVTLSSGNNTTLLQMHPLFHSWVHYSVQEQQIPKFRSAAALLLALGARKTPTRSTQYLASHVNHLLSQWIPDDLNDRWAFGDILSDANQHNAALKLRENVVEELRYHLQENDAVFHTVLEVLANTYSKLNRLEDAEKLHDVLLKLRMTAFGEHNENTILSYNTLATTYRKLGRLMEAEEKQVEVLRLRMDMLGSDHPDVVVASFDLAETYRDLGRYDQAETLLVEVRRIRTKLFGSAHPDTIIATSNLALTYFVSRRLDEAKVLQLEVISLSRITLGVEHPETLIASSNLALTYRDLGQLEEARALQENVLASTRKVFGEGHSDTVSAYRELGYTCCSMGRISDAERLQAEGLKLTTEIFGERHRNAIFAMQKLLPLQVRILQSQKQVLGEGHPDTIRAHANLALTHHKLGDLLMAEALYIVVVKLTRQLYGAVQGDRHPTTLSAMQKLVPIQIKLLQSRNQLLGRQHVQTLLASSNLATTYRCLGQLSQAETLQVESLKLREQLLGVDHLETILASSDLALTYRDMGRLTAAERLQVGVVQQRFKLLGRKHLDTLLALSNLAITCLALGKRADAKRHQEEVCMHLHEVLGREHPETILASSNLGLTYHHTGKHRTAMEYQKETLTAWKKTAGESHPDTMTASRNLAITYCSLNMFPDAEQLQADVVRLMRAKFGEQHPATISALDDLASIQLKGLNWSKTSWPLPPPGEARPPDGSKKIRQRRNAVSSFIPLPPVPDPYLLSVSSNLALTYCSLGRINEAEALLVDVVEKTQQNLGIDHPNLTSAYRNLSVIYRHLGRSTEAELMEAAISRRVMTALAPTDIPPGLSPRLEQMNAWTWPQFNSESGTDLQGLRSMQQHHLAAHSDRTKPHMYGGYISDSD